MHCTFFAEARTKTFLTSSVVEFTGLLSMSFVISQFVCKFVADMWHCPRTSTASTKRGSSRLFRWTRTWVHACCNRPFGVFLPYFVCFSCLYIANFIYCTYIWLQTKGYLQRAINVHIVISKSNCACHEGKFHALDDSSVPRQSDQRLEPGTIHPLFH